MDWQRLFWMHMVLAVWHSVVALWVGLSPTQFYTTMDGYSQQFEVGQMSWWFLLLAATDHVITASSCRNENGLYRAWVQGDHMPVLWRWIEYSFSASLMNVQIVLLCRCTAVVWALVVALSTMLMMVLGAVAEPRALLDSRMRAICVACSWLCFGMAWAVIVTFYADNASGAPGFVHAIIAILFVCESAFGVVFSVYYNADSDAEKYHRELAYGLLSMVAKSSLALITWGGARAQGGGDSQK